MRNRLRLAIVIVLIPGFFLSRGLSPCERSFVTLPHSREPFFFQALSLPGLMHPRRQPKDPSAMIFSSAGSRVPHRDRSLEAETRLRALAAVPLQRGSGAAGFDYSIRLAYASLPQGHERTTLQLIRNGDWFGYLEFQVPSTRDAIRVTGIRLKPEFFGLGLGQALLRFALNEAPSATRLEWDRPRDHAGRFLHSLVQRGLINNLQWHAWRDEATAALSSPRMDWTASDRMIHQQLGYRYNDVESALRTRGQRSPYTGENWELVTTPMNLVREVISRLRLGPDDVFMDLGAGDGRVVLYAADTTPVRKAIGIELVEARVQEARRIQATHRIPRTEFQAIDIRQADLSEGTKFFLFSPFYTEALNAALEKLRAVARDHPIEIAVFGHQIAEFRQLPWLQAAIEIPRPGTQDVSTVIFRSIDEGFRPVKPVRSMAGAA